MKSYLLALNHGYLFFGTTVYVGVLWAMRFFWYPSWGQITLADVPVHFVGPTSRATSFFTVVVPLMLLANLILIISERKSPTVILAIIAALCIGSATYVGQAYIIPVNKLIGAGLTTQQELHEKLGLWMNYNTIRFWLLSPMWLIMLLYFVIKGHLLDVLAGRQL
ncbi:MAG: hypothetical protein RL701_6888 [Pseudomonadota bacterium]|jgi:glucan phosphoethanolaminetransferase (alkaline phosphatase superfamily)